MSEIGKRIENLGITLPVRDRKGQGAVDASSSSSSRFSNFDFL